MIAALIALLTLTPQTPPADWPIGTEREVEAGVYMQVVASESGWRVWRTEQRSGVSCKAVKSAAGRPHPRPIGVGDALFTGTPYLTIGLYQDRFTYRWSARHLGKVRVKYRTPGDRFWEEGAEVNFPANVIGERPIEIEVTSWEYPAIYEGYSEEAATFDLAGLAWAQEQVRVCSSAPIVKPTT